MEDGGVDRTVIDCWQNQLGQMADFPPLLFILVFDLLRLDAPQIKSQTLRHALMNLVKHHFILKMCGLIIEISIYGSVLNSCIYISLYPCCLLIKQISPSVESHRTR